ncbi:MAG TPA: hypothetical protein VES97_06435 [Solirubrobacteraceae bacterium]|nr:hypothetical protein [Solirubrobacteraceae bacterium]
MRPSLFNPRGERRYPRRRRRARAAMRARPLAAAPDPAVQPVEDPIVQPAPDPAVQRVREAGGPVDLACYACACGYLFVAPVSTSVRCPHCGAGQAW